MPNHIPLLSNTHKRNILARSTANLTPSVSRTMGEQFDEASMTAATGSVLRMVKMGGLADATGGLTGIREGTAHGGSASFMQPMRTAHDQIEDQKFLSAQSNNHNWGTRDNVLEMIKDRGYSEHDIPISDIGANILVVNEIMDRHDAQKKRQDIISRGSDGRGMALFASSMAVGLTDPIELALNFVPWVGPARRLNALRKAGKSAMARFGVRARFGAIESAIGQAVIEPLPLLASQSDLTDYGIEESIMNITYGTVLGTGMHMGMGYMADGINRSLGRSLDRGPNGATSSALEVVPDDILQKNIEISVNASIQNRNLKVDEFMSLGNVSVKPAQGFSIGSRSLDEILDDPATPSVIRNLAENADTIEELGVSVKRQSDKLAKIDRNNVNALREFLTKEEARPLSTFLENQGGLKVDDAIGKAIDTTGRPKLFKKPGKGGMSVSEAIKKAREAGYDIPTGKGNFFMKTLADDVTGKKRILTADAEAKLRGSAEALRSADAFGPTAKTKNQTQDLKGFNDGFHSPDNIRGFNAERTAEVDRLIEKHADFTTEDMKKALEDLQTAIKDLSDDAAPDNTALMRQIENIDTKARIHDEAMEKLTNCMIAGGL